MRCFLWIVEHSEGGRRILGKSVFLIYLIVSVKTTRVLGLSELRKLKGLVGYPLIGAAIFAGLGLMAVLADADRATPKSLRKSTPSPQEDLEPEFTFVRSVYSGIYGWGYYKSWATDWPKADRQFILGIKRLTNIKVADRERTIPLNDPEIFRFPFIYSVEVGHWDLTDAEVINLREYLQRGGFLFCDDFWGSVEWENYYQNISRVLPGCKIVELPLSHPIFHCYYDIPQILQVPNVGNALYRGITYEQDGYVPYCRGIFDDNGRLMVIINWNTDLGDAWEWADLPGYPAKYSTYAYQMGINAIVYAMSH